MFIIIDKEVYRLDKDNEYYSFYVSNHRYISK